MTVPQTYVLVWLSCPSLVCLLEQPPKSGWHSRGQGHPDRREDQPALEAFDSVAGNPIYACLTQRV